MSTVVPLGLVTPNNFALPSAGACARASSAVANVGNVSRRAAGPFALPLRWVLVVVSLVVSFIGAVPSGRAGRGPGPPDPAPPACLPPAGGVAAGTEPPDQPPSLGPQTFCTRISA